MKLLNSEYKKRAMFYAISNCASVNDHATAKSKRGKTVVFIVDSNEWDDHEDGNKLKFTVLKYDESLNKFTPHFTTPWTDTKSFDPVLKANRIFIFCTEINTVSETMNRQFIHCRMSSIHSCIRR